MRLVAGAFGGVRIGPLQGHQFGAQGFDLGLQGLELVAAHQVQFGDHAVGLGAHGGLGFLARRLAPRLAETAPAAAIVVAGRDPSRKLAERIAARPNMQLLVDPPEVAPLLARADLMLVPLFQGGGTRLKALEALAAGLPLVATPLAVEGLDLVPEREVLLGRGARDLVRQCLRLLEDQGLYRRLSAAGLAAYAARFAPEVLGPKVAAALEAAVQR